MCNNLQDKWDYIDYLSKIVPKGQPFTRMNRFDSAFGENCKQGSTSFVSLIAVFASYNNIPNLVVDLLRSLVADQILFA